MKSSKRRPLRLHSPKNTVLSSHPMARKLQWNTTSWFCWRRSWLSQRPSPSRNGFPDLPKLAIASHAAQPICIGSTRPSLVPGMRICTRLLNSPNLHSLYLVAGRWFALTNAVQPFLATTRARGTRRVPRYIALVRFS